LKEQEYRQSKLDFQTYAGIFWQKKYAVRWMTIFSVRRRSKRLWWQYGKAIKSLPKLDTAESGQG
jgi:hypothetical protein